MELIQPGRANVIIDAQWGSTGKGKLAGWMCSTHRIHLAVCDYMPNAGHTLVVNGKSLTFCQLPVAAAFNVECCIGPHAAIDVDLFFRELEDCTAHLGRTPTVWIHPLASVVTAENRSTEQSHTSRIAATCKGGHAAAAAKMLRSRDARMAKDEPRLRPFLVDTHSLAHARLRTGATLIIETAQGFDLGLNHGSTYPYVTGRDCLVGRALDNAGVPVSRVGSIIGSLRTFPIRVGNTAEGESGPCYPDQTELTWGELRARTGVKIEPELTTVTKRVRRVFTFSFTQLSRFVDYCGPTDLFLNFANYLQGDQREKFVQSLQRWASIKNTRLALIGTGAENSDMIVL